MTKFKSLTLTEAQHSSLKSHLFPGDGNEAAAIMICEHVGTSYQRLIVRDIVTVPYAACPTRTPDRLTWPGEYIEDAIDLAESRRCAIILIHSHPGSTLCFSEIDDTSDSETIPCLHQAVEPLGNTHGSSIMIPDGTMKLRLYSKTNELRENIMVHCIGDNISRVDNPTELSSPFGKEMRSHLSQKTACIIGVSGTGSIVAEMLARDSIGELILIDPDVMKIENINRILNSNLKDVENETPKPELTASAISGYAPNTVVNAINRSILHPDALRAATNADIIFCCVDSMEGRMFAERICRCCLIPLIDLGVTIPTRATSESSVTVAEVCGRIDYVHPEGSNLSNRKVVTSSGLRAEYLFSVDPNAAEEELRNGYIDGVHEEAPSVMFLNMQAASLAVYEWYSRMFQLRMDGNQSCARTMFSLFASETEYFGESEFSAQHFVPLGSGLSTPVLGLPSISGSL